MTRGDIVLVQYPFTDLSGSKLRPAIVVSTDAVHNSSPDAIFVLVTSTLKMPAGLPTWVLIDVTTPDGLASGLLHTSVVKCDHPMTLDKQLVKRTVGRVPPNLMALIDAAIKVGLGLP